MDKMDLKIFALLVFLVNTISGTEISNQNLHGYQVLRTRPGTEAQYQALVNLYSEGDFDFWTGPAMATATDVMVAPHRLPVLLDYFDRHSIVYNVFIDDVASVIEKQKQSARYETGMNWNEYQTLETIYDWIDDLVSLYPNLITVTNIGPSTEGRNLKVLKLSTGGSNKTAFWIDATIHAREWISTSTITYIINELVTNQTVYNDLYDVLDFYILPIVNPDGYVYTHTTNRMWRKTRSNYDNSTYCYGVDANRNFGFQWGGPGSSGNKCSGIYRGPEAYSEPETLAIKNYIEGQRQNGVQWDTFITLHSYSQLWMTPYGYTKEVPSDYEELKILGDAAVAELTSHYGTFYQVGNAASILYESSGSSRDWAKGEGGFKYVYTIELRDQGEYGFLLPPEQIIPTAIETWAGIQVVAQHYLEI